MMNTKPAIFLLFLIAQFTFRANAQGCSDAGVCTIHSIKDNTAEGNKAGEKKNELAISLSFGKGEDDVSYYGLSVDYTRQLKNISLSGKFDLVSIHGRLGKTFGPAGLFISASKPIHVKKKIVKSAIIGFRIPLGGASLSKNGIELPMPYQPSLGTFDVIAGMNFFYRQFGQRLQCSSQ